MTFRDEQPHCERITIRRTGREALVRHVEEREQLLLVDDIGDLLPLRGRRVHPRRVVSASMQKHNGPLRRVLATKKRLS